MARDLPEERVAIRQEAVKALVRPAKGKTRDAMEKTLARIEKVVTAK